MIAMCGISNAGMVSTNVLLLYIPVNLSRPRLICWGTEISEHLGCCCWQLVPLGIYGLKLTQTSLFIILLTQDEHSSKFFRPQHVDSQWCELLTIASTGTVQCVSPSAHVLNCNEPNIPGTLDCTIKCSGTKEMQNVEQKRYHANVGTKPRYLCLVSTVTKLCMAGSFVNAQSCVAVAFQVVRSRHITDQEHAGCTH